MTRKLSLLVVAFGFASVLCMCSSNDGGQGTPVPAQAITQPAPAPASPPPPPEPTLADKVNALTTLTDVIAVLQPLMEDTRGEMSQAVALLALWMNAHPNWKELNALTSTKYKLVMKDPTAARGKLLCKKGKISEIQVDRSADPPLWIGGIVSGWTDITRFVAVGSTGELVSGSQATICGVVTGLDSYANVSGGTTHSVQVVGIFKLKANKKLGAE